MPSRDPKTGKFLSGGAKRKRAKQRATAYAQAAATSKVPVPSYTDFARLPAPPLGNPAEAIAWTNDALLIALHQVLRDPALSNLERWRWTKDLGAVIAMARDKSAEQVRLKKLAESVGQAPASGSAPPGAKPLASVLKPATARRASRGTSI